MLPFLAPLLAPVPLLLAGATGFFDHGPRPKYAPLLAEAVSLLALLAAAGSLILHGAGDGRVIGIEGAGLSVRLDAVSVAMLLLVTFVGWIVVRYARRYLDGDDRQGRFTAWLCLTLAAVALLVTAGNLVQLVIAWIATSLFLHRLLLFYP
ncbi:MULTISPECIES: hypothetical protein [unclassified Acidocella]|uniref:hypothetical protein n=1 Tax=unclassified Acidocella TaxID=2648610 RepID=UPI001F097D4F|nr:MULTISPECIES: hypothetical protein [unclassified Acidocella]WBO58083.1 hypothetical protein GT370_12520 [Acidocella sp. MX-AZ03]